LSLCAAIVTAHFQLWGKGMKRRLLSLVSASGAIAIAALVTAQANTLTDPDGRLRGGTPDSIRIRGIGEILSLQRTMVPFETKEKPGTIIVFTAQRKLYLVTAPGQALRYGVGVGRDGYTWNGIHTVTNKREWPDWRPPPEMLKRQPGLPRHMKGGPGNPLGARALYIGSTIYRIHGTHDPDSVGEADSSGCIRLTNPDIVDLYERVKVGAKVIVVK
jgi:lipoprotein-anchoring transpeptidase ErfK/SrfK